MEFITESHLDEITEQLGTMDDQETLFRELANEQPVLLAFLVSDNIQMLTEQEQELLYFLAFIIWKAIARVHPDIPLIEENLLGKIEESNWELLEGHNQGNFSERITPFFTDHPQEDLLAFIEDSLIFDEESQVTNEGRIYLFVILKTVVDAFVGVLAK